MKFTTDEVVCSLAGATGASVVLGAWFLAAGYTVIFLGIVLWKAARS